MDLFSYSQESTPNNRLLADRLRPTSLDEYIGQEHVVGPGKLLRRAIEADQVSSILLYGPPGCGKTTLAHIISQHTQGDFVRLNAVEASVKDVREVIDRAQTNKSMYGKKLFCFSTRYIGLTVHVRMHCCLRWKRARSCLLAPRLKIPFTTSTAL